MRPTRTWSAVLFVLLTASCGRTPPERPTAPLVHRFTDPARWTKEFDDPARDAWQKPADVVGSMHIASGMTVADIGAGTGYFEPYLSRAVGPGGIVLAVDVEPEMVRWLSDRGEREHWGNVRPLLGEAVDPRLSVSRVDRVLIVDTWHHVPDPAAFASRLRAALAPGGTLTVVDFTQSAPMGPPKEHRVAPDKLLSELRVAGFVAEQLDVELPYQYVIVAK